MATSKDTIAAMLEGLAPLDVRARAMFGGHTIYCDDKVVALVCDHRFYLKPTAATAEDAGSFEHGPPYPGAADHLIVDERRMLDRVGFRRLVQATADARPKPKPKRKRPR